MSELAFGIGLLITLVASACYVTTWEVIYYWFAPDFAEKYGAYMLAQAREAGATEQELATRAAEYGYEAFALTDHDNVCGAMEFAHACAVVGVRPIAGCELTVEVPRRLPLRRRRRVFA